MKEKTKAMINYSRERALEIMKAARSAILATNGRSGVQASECPCEVVGLDIYLLLPRTSDHLFNLEHDDRVALHTEQWEVTGKGQILSPDEKRFQISLFPKTETAYYDLVKIVPSQIQILRSEGWGPAETIDLTPFQ